MKKFKLGDYVRGEDKRGIVEGTIFQISDINSKNLYLLRTIDGGIRLYWENEITTMDDDFLKERNVRRESARLEHILEDPYGEENWV